MARSGWSGAISAANRGGAPRGWGRIGGGYSFETPQARQDSGGSFGESIARLGQVASRLAEEQAYRNAREQQDTARGLAMGQASRERQEDALSKVVGTAESDAEKLAKKRQEQAQQAEVKAKQAEAQIGGKVERYQERVDTDRQSEADRQSDRNAMFAQQQAAASQALDERAARDAQREVYGSDRQDSVDGVDTTQNRAIRKAVAFLQDKHRGLTGDEKDAAIDRDLTDTMTRFERGEVLTDSRGIAHGLGRADVAALEGPESQAAMFESLRKANRSALEPTGARVKQPPTVRHTPVPVPASLSGWQVDNEGRTSKELAAKLGLDPERTFERQKQVVPAEQRKNYTADEIERFGLIFSDDPGATPTPAPPQESFKGMGAATTSPATKPDRSAVVRAKLQAQPTGATPSNLAPGRPAPPQPTPSGSGGALPAQAPGWSPLIDVQKASRTVSPQEFYADRPAVSQPLRSAMLGKPVDVQQEKVLQGQGSPLATFQPPMRTYTEFAKQGKELAPNQGQVETFERQPKEAQEIILAQPPDKQLETLDALRFAEERYAREIQAGATPEQALAAAQESGRKMQALRETQATAKLREEEAKIASGEKGLIERGYQGVTKQLHLVNKAREIQEHEATRDPGRPMTAQEAKQYGDLFPGIDHERFNQNSPEMRGYLRGLAGKLMEGVGENLSAVDVAALLATGISGGAGLLAKAAGASKLAAQVGRGAELVNLGVDAGTALLSGGAAVNAYNKGDTGELLNRAAMTVLPGATAAKSAVSDLPAVTRNLAQITAAEKAAQQLPVRLSLGGQAPASAADAVQLPAPSQADFAALNPRAAQSAPRVSVVDQPQVPQFALAAHAAPGEVVGSFNPKTNEIQVGSGADLSTPAHEFAHSQWGAMSPNERASLLQRVERNVAESFGQERWTAMTPQERMRAAEEGAVESLAQDWAARRMAGEIPDQAPRGIVTRAADQVRDFAREAIRGGNVEDAFAAGAIPEPTLGRRIGQKVRDVVETYSPSRQADRLAGEMVSDAEMRALGFGGSVPRELAGEGTRASAAGRMAPRIDHSKPLRPEVQKILGEGVIDEGDVLGDMGYLPAERRNAAWGDLTKAVGSSRDALATEFEARMMSVLPEDLRTPQALSDAWALRDSLNVRDATEEAVREFAGDTGPDGVQVLRPSPSMAIIVQRHNGKIVGGLVGRDHPGRGWMRDGVFGGQAAGSPVSVRPVYEAADQLGIPPSPAELLSPAGRASQIHAARALDESLRRAEIGVGGQNGLSGSGGSGALGGDLPQARGGSEGAGRAAGGGGAAGPNGPEAGRLAQDSREIDAALSRIGPADEVEAALSRIGPDEGIRASAKRRLTKTQPVPDTEPLPNRRQARREAQGLSRDIPDDPSAAAARQAEIDAQLEANFAKSGNPKPAAPPKQGPAVPPEIAAKNAADTEARLATDQAAENKAAAKTRLKGEMRQALDDVKDALFTRGRFFGEAGQRIGRAKSLDGANVGAPVEKALYDSTDQAEQLFGQGKAVVNTALGALRKAVGRNNFEASFRRIAMALDGKRSLKDLAPHERAVADRIRSVFSSFRNQAEEAGVPSEKWIERYWPHMNKEGKPTYDALVERHAKVLEDEHAKLVAEGNGSQSRLSQLRDENDTWLQGLMDDFDPTATNKELAAIDISKHHQDTTWRAENPHLERSRSDAMMGPVRYDPAVIDEYMAGASKRIAYVKNFGPDGESIRVAIGRMKPEDQAFTRDVIQTTFGRRQGPLGGPGVDRLRKEAQAWTSARVLGSSAVSQFGQAFPALGKTIGQMGPVKGTKHIVGAMFDSISNPRAVGGEATRSGALAGNQMGEIGREFGGNEALTHKAFRYIVSGGGQSEPLKKLVDSNYGNQYIDGAVRAMTDNLARRNFVELVRRKDVDALSEVFNHRAQAETAAKLDPAKLEKFLAREDTGIRSLDPREGVGIDPDLALMDRFAKRFTDQTSLRIHAYNQPLVFNSPGVKLFNSMLGYAYQGWRFQVNEAKELTKALRKAAGGDKAAVEAAKRRGLTLAASNLIFAPLLGGAVLYGKAALKGQGLASQKRDDYKTTYEQALQTLSNEPIDGREGPWSAALLYLQMANAGGLSGYPGAILERANRAAQVGTTRKGDSVKAIAGAMGPALQPPTVALLKLGPEWYNYLTTVSNGTSSPKEYDRLMRETTLFWTSQLAPNVLGVASDIGRNATATAERPNRRPGWATLAQRLWEGKPVSYSPVEGVTTPEGTAAIRKSESDERRERAKARLRSQKDWRKWEQERARRR